MNKLIVFFVLLLLAVQCSAIGLVYTKHKSRQLFVELESMKNNRDQLTTEFGQLQLEQGTWATHSRIERLATQKLDMHIPAHAAIKMIQKR